MMKRAFLIPVLGLLTLLLAVGCTCSHKKVKNQEDTTLMEPLYDIQTSMGTIRVKLYAKTPKHRENFEKLAAEKFFDGILFHRVIDGFMIQSGDPLTRDTSRVQEWGTGGPGYTVPAEIQSEYRHLKGALAAARRGDFVNPTKASSGSQFYLVQDAANCAQLDGEYTVFGQAVEGLDVIDAIASVPTNFRDCPLSPVVIISVSKVEPEAPKEAADSASVREEPADSLPSSSQPAD